MSSCTKYDMQWWNFLVPSIYEFSTICDSYDKTYMFLVSLSRFIFYLLVFLFLRNNNIIVFDEYAKLQYFFYIVFLTITILSFINVIMITLKRQTNPQKQVEIELERAPVPKEQVIPIQIFDNEQTQPNEMAVSIY